MTATLKATLCALTFTCLILSGCGGISLNSDYYDYSDVYGKSVNKQLLLNLARLSRDEPPYFLQLGNFSAQHTLTGGLGLGNKSTGLDKAVGLTELDGTASIGGTEQPIFQFVPLNGDPYAQAFTSPLNQKIFYTFYDQNLPADMLARTMIQSVDIKYVTKWPDLKTQVTKTLVNDPLDPTYPDFLVWCYLLRNYQLEHRLTVQVGQPQDKSQVHKIPNVNITDYSKAIDYSLRVANDPTTPDYTDQKSGKVFLTDMWIDEPKFVATNKETRVDGRTDFSFSFVTEPLKSTDNHTDPASRAILLESVGASTSYSSLNGTPIKMRTYFSVLQATSSCSGRNDYRQSLVDPAR